MTDRTKRMGDVLTASFQPDKLVIDDESARHAGHAGAAPGGQTHFNVLLVSSRFVGLGRVERSRLVNKALQGEFDTGLHALAVTLRTPDEYRNDASHCLDPGIVPQK